VRSRKRYTADELDARLQFVVGVTLCVGLLTLLLSSLYGLLFVYQGDSLSPVDAEFFKLMNPIAMFLTGTLAGIMASKGLPKRGNVTKSSNDGLED
jgi:hypothetical protein